MKKLEVTSIHERKRDEKHMNMVTEDKNKDKANNEVKITEIDLTLGNWVTLVTKSFIATLFVGGLFGLAFFILFNVIVGL